MTALELAEWIDEEMTKWEHMNPSVRPGVARYLAGRLHAEEIVPRPKPR